MSFELFNIMTTYGDQVQLNIERDPYITLYVLHIY